MGAPPPQLPFVDATTYRCLMHKLYPLVSTTSHNCRAAAAGRCYSSYYCYGCSYYTPPPLFSCLSGPTSIMSQIVPNITLRRRRRRSPTAAAALPLPESRQPPAENNDDQEEEEEGGLGGLREKNYWGGTNSIIVWACVVGMLTGVSVVLFNNGVHELRDLFFWDGGIPYRGASWLREEPLSSIWSTRLILAPACGGLAVSILNAIRSGLPPNNNNNNNKAAAAAVALLLEPFLKATAACFTLGTGNSLGPEGPSVEIGASIAKAITSFNSKIIINPQTKLSLLAAGSAAGISSGFNAAVAGCFFAVESVLWPSPPADDSSTPLTNTTSMVILSAVIASVVSEVGLGSEPAFKVPVYDFRSFGELPLYLLLGVLCGFISLALSRCTSTMLSFVNDLHNSTGIPRTVFPVLGGFATGIIALAYPEVLYWGFENVDILLESRPFVNSLSAQLLLQLVGIKILATSLCRASGLVGGYYAPSLFIGAAAGMAYGKLINFALAQSDPMFQISIFEVASPQAYGLVGMAATLAGVCQVPLTSVLLLFELTQDYRIVLPLLGAVGMSSWITSRQIKTNIKETIKPRAKGTSSTRQTESSSSESSGLSSGGLYGGNKKSLCEVESSLCVDDSIIESELLKGKVRVSEAMRTRYVTVLMRTSLMEVVTIMLAEKQSCAMIVDQGNTLIGLLTLGHIANFSKLTKGRKRKPQELLVSEMCASDDNNCRVPWTANPGMDILSVRVIMDNYGLSQVPVVSDQNGHPVGLIDRECISVTCRALATRESLA